MNFFKIMIRVLPPLNINQKTISQVGCVSNERTVNKQAYLDPIIYDLSKIDHPNDYSSFYSERGMGM